MLSLSLIRFAFIEKVMIACVDFNPMSQTFVPVSHILRVHWQPELCCFVKPIRCSVHCYACQRFLLLAALRSWQIGFFPSSAPSGSGHRRSLVVLHRKVFIDYELRVESEMTDSLYSLDQNSGFLSLMCPVTEVL